jgi:hypothetical protein
MRLMCVFPLLSVLLAACAAGAPQQAAPTERPLVASPTATALALPIAGETAGPLTPSPTATALASPTAGETAGPPTATSMPTAAPPSPSPAAPAPIAAACQHRYYPVAQGAAWTYRVSGSVNDTFTRAIISVRADGFDDQDSFASGAVRRGSWACRQGDLISLTPGGGASVAAGGVQTDFTIESNEGLTLPADPQAGARWTQTIVYLGQFNTGDRNVTARSTLNTSCQAVGVESVSVPAGAFEALRADCTHRLTIALLGDLPFDFSFSSNGSAWYAPGVGLVKLRDVSEMGTTEVVLLSFALP